MKWKMTTALVLFGLLFATGVVLADTEPNNDVGSAEKMNFIKDYPGTVGDGDNVDFYYIDVTPKTILKVSIEYVPSNGSYTSYLNVEAKQRNNDKVEFKADFSGSTIEKKMVKYENKEKDSVQLFIKVSGNSEYVLDPEITTSVGTICCGSTVLLGIVALAGIVVVGVVVRKRF